VIQPAHDDAFLFKCLNIADTCTAAFFDSNSAEKIIKGNSLLVCQNAKQHSAPASPLTQPNSAVTSNPYGPAESVSDDDKDYQQHYEKEKRERDTGRVGHG
jgi:hypothetical protein